MSKQSVQDSTTQNQSESFAARLCSSWEEYERQRLDDEAKFTEEFRGIIGRFEAVSKEMDEVVMV